MAARGSWPASSSLSRSRSRASSRTNMILPRDQLFSPARRAFISSCARGSGSGARYPRSQSARHPPERRRISAHRSGRDRREAGADGRPACPRPPAKSAGATKRLHAGSVAFNIPILFDTLARWVPEVQAPPGNERCIPGHGLERHGVERHGGGVPFRLRRSRPDDPPPPGWPFAGNRHRFRLRNRYLPRREEQPPPRIVSPRGSKGDCT